jgi:hypothetical protein
VPHERESESLYRERGREGERERGREGEREIERKGERQKPFLEVLTQL